MRIAELQRFPVSLSGLSFLNLGDEYYNAWNTSFRPLIGVIISKRYPYPVGTIVSALGFPSPYRGYYF